jgi:hypothetical protein
MNRRRMLISSITLMVLIVGVSVYAQVNRPYHNGFSLEHCVYPHEARYGNGLSRLSSRALED